MEKEIYINNKKISEFKIVLRDKASGCELFAASEFQKYIYKSHAALLEICVDNGAESGVIQLRVYDAEAGDVGFDTVAEDGYVLSCDGDRFCVCGGSERGLLYGVYEFLERFAGWRFFAGETPIRGENPSLFSSKVEKNIGKDTVHIESGFYRKDEPVIRFRDSFGHAVRSEEWCVKNRFNGDIWKLKNIPAEMGGSVTFSGSGGHTFALLVPQEQYGKSHPDYYAQIDGKRRVFDPEYIDPQLCLTNEEVPGIVAQSVKEILKQNGGVRIVSVSQNDNGYFCECPECKAQEEKIGKGGLLIQFVNRVCVLLEQEYPDVLIHTYAYEKTVENITGVALHKNILLQYCLRSCRRHTLDDGNCKVNQEIYKSLKLLKGMTDNIFIYDYRSSEAYTFLMLPDVFVLRDQMRCLADNNVTGMYAESDIFCSNSPTMEELRAYLLGKLLWNPYMDSGEFERHIDEFLAGYYGNGWRHMKAYLTLLHDNTHHLHIDSVLGNIADDGGFDCVDNHGSVIRAKLFDDSIAAELCEKMHGLFDEAAKNATEEERDRIEITRTAIIWYELYWSMEEILITGTETEKRMVVERNRDLCARMRKYCMKYTSFIGMSPTTEMFNDFTLPPSKWNYWQHGNNRKIFLAKEVPA